MIILCVISIKTYLEAYQRIKLKASIKETQGNVFAFPSQDCTSLVVGSTHADVPVESSAAGLSGFLLAAQNDRANI